MRILVNNSNSITFEIDSSIYSNQVLTKCLYWYTSQFNVSINDSAGGKGKVIVLEFKDKQESLVGDKLVEKLKQDLIDYNLREIVEKETKIIRELLIAKAFSNPQTRTAKFLTLSASILKVLSMLDEQENREKRTRKFKDAETYVSASESYFLLPFRFHRINNEKEVIVNEVGDFLIVLIGTTERIIKKQVAKSEELYDDLLAGFFISESPIPKLMEVLETRYRTKKSFLDYFTTLHIFVITLRCEHTCHYCQVSRVTDNKQDFDMTRYHIDEGIKLMMQSPSPNITMEFQGGEALLAFDNIQYAILKAKEESTRNNKSINFVVCTNLAPLTDEILFFCKEHEVMISTSLDGPDYIHNKNRHRPGNNSYELTIDGIQKCVNVIGRERVSALLTTTNLSLDFPIEIVDEYVKQGFNSIFLRPISPFGFAVHNPKKNQYQTGRFLDFYKIALNHILEYNKNGHFLREDYATVILRKMFTPFPVGYVDLQSPAGLIINVIAFNYDGKVFASDESRMLAEMNDFTFQLGKLGVNTYNEIFYGDQTSSILESSVNESLAGCSDCGFQTYCGADPVLNHATQGNMNGHRPTNTFCQKNMEIIRHIFELIDEDGNNERIFRSWITGRTS